MAERTDRAESLMALIERAHAALDVEDYAALGELIEQFDREARACAGNQDASAAHEAAWPALAEAFAALQQRIVISRDEASVALRSLHGSRNRANAYGRAPGDEA